MFSQGWLCVESAFAVKICLNVKQGDSLLPLVLQESPLPRPLTYHPQQSCHILCTRAASKEEVAKPLPAVHQRHEMPFPHPDVSVILLIRFPKTGNNLFLKKADALGFLLPILPGGRQPQQLPHPRGSASPRSGDQSHPSPITVDSGCQLHDTPPTHPAGEALCIHQASPERHTAIWKA